MFHRFMLTLLALALPAAFPSPSSAQDDAEVRRELDAQYRKLAAAHDRKDLKAIAALKTQDFHSIFPDGKVGDVQTMAQYTKDFVERNQPPFHIRNTIETMTVSENRLIAVVEVLQEVSRKREMAGKVRDVDTRVRQRETWARTPDGWKLKCVDHVRDQMRIVDGKRVDPSKPYDPNAPPFEPDSSGVKSR